MDLNACLNRYYESKIKINRNERTDALEVWQNLVEEILDEVKRLDPRFSLRIQYTGSFYERVKTESPNEFDLMLVLEKIAVNIEKRVLVDGFTFVYISDSQTLWSRDNIVDSRGRLNAVQMRAVFSRLVGQAITNVQKRHVGKRITASTHGPAVTLNIKIGSSQYDVDLTLAIKLPSWPATAKTWLQRPRRGWPNAELINEVRKGGCHVVAKQPDRNSGEDSEVHKGGCHVAKQPVRNSGEDRKFLWRFSFSEAEKTIMRKVDSGNSNSVRRRVLQILKAIISNDPQLQSVPLKSYHMKTLIFWESEKYPSGEDWNQKKLKDRFSSAVNQILSYVKKERFPHYFLNNVNLMHNFKKPHFGTIARKFEEIKKDPVSYFGSASS